MAKYSGVVGYISEKKWKDKTFYSFTLKGVDGFFGCGMTRPRFKVGGYVEFESEKNDKGFENVDLKTLKDSPSAPASSKDSAAPAAAPAGNSQKYVDFRAEADKQRQKSIHFQSAHKDAIELAKFMVDKEFVKLPAAVNKKYDAVLVLVENLTDKFFAQFESEHTVEEAPIEASDEVEVQEEE